MILSVLFLLLNCSIINCISLMRSRAISHSETNRIIHASLTDKDTGNFWQIQEWVNSEGPRTGRIEIKSVDNEANVFYSYKSSKDNNQRLVIHDNFCDLYNYDLKWDKLLPGVNKPLTNLILLMGPSLLDRISSFDWRSGNDENIRGLFMHSVSVDLDGKLNITLYYETNLNQMNGVSQPSQIVFTGYNPDSLVEGEAETLILDIYLQSQVTQKLNNLVQVTPGFGCPVYLNGDLPFPALNAVKIHYIVSEQVDDKKKAINEIHADETYQVLRLSEFKFGYERKKLFDYTLGSEYQLSSTANCYTSPIDSSAPGIDERGSFTIAKLLWLSPALKYLGEIAFEKKSNFKVHVWESIETNRVINDVTYDKVVTTQYMSLSYQNDIFNDYSPVAASIKAYKKDTKGAYVLATTIHRDFYDSNNDLPESAYHEVLQIVDCFKKPETRLNLKFHLVCKDYDGCIQKSQDSVYEMKELLRSNLIGRLGISTTRITYIDFKFQKEVIEADVTFLEAPKISEFLPYKFYTLMPNQISKLHETVAESNEKCLRYHASFVPPGGAIIYCDDDNLCFSTMNVKDATESKKGVYCYVYTDPYKKLNRLGSEKPLSDLHDHILAYFEHITFNMNLDDKGKAVAFQVMDVIAQDGNVKEQEKPFTQLRSFKQFDQIDGVHTVMVPGIDDFGDCYRACSQNEDIPCESFSFCGRKTKSECYVSIRSKGQLVNLTSDSDCTIYVKNHITDFTQRSKLKYKHPTTVSRKLFASDCAAECYASKDCVSFELCGADKCTFGGYSTATNTEFSESCNIYTPKSSLKYTVTGMKLVSQVLYTEVEVDLDQCATLCDDDQSCKSFNFCPKGKSPSQCQITSYSIEDPKTELVDSSICHNYELTDNSNAKTISDNSPDIKTSGASGGGIFVIIILFLFIGLFAGFVCPYVYTKVETRNANINKSKDNFEWSRQEDEDENQTQI